MRSLVSRLMLAVAAAILGFGSVMHLMAFFSKASRSIEGSNLGTFFGKEMKVLWVADSTTLAAVALVFGLIAAKPQSAARPLLIALVLIPAATTSLLYYYLGPFYAAHMLLAASLLALGGGLLLPLPRGIK